MQKNKYIYYFILFILIACNNDALIVEEYENGSVKQEGLIVDGKKEGIHKWYYKNGNIEIIANYKNDLLEDTSKFYYEDGSYQGYRVYKNNYAIGRGEEFFSSGELKTKFLYTYQNETSIKEAYSYFKDGSNDSYAIYKDDSLIYYLQFNENGNLKSEYRKVNLIIPDTVIFNENFFAKILVEGPVRSEDSLVVMRCEIMEGRLSSESNLQIGKYVEAYRLHGNGNLEMKIFADKVGVQHLVIDVHYKSKYGSTIFRKIVGKEFMCVP